MRTVCLTMKRMKTYSMKAGEIDKRWHVVNAEGETLGRLAARVAGLLMGKHKPTYSPPPDMGGFVGVGVRGRGGGGAGGAAGGRGGAARRGGREHRPPSPAPAPPPPPPPGVPRLRR